MRLAALFGLSLLALLIATQAANAQQDGHRGYARIVVPANLLNERVGNVEPVPTNGEWLESLTIYADGQFCGVLPVLHDDGTNVESDAVFELGLDGQPEVCSVGGARLTYLDSSDRILFQKHYLEAGGEYIIDNFAPEPPVDPSPYPQVLIPARVLDTAEADAIGRLQVVADGDVCGEIVLTDPSIRNEDGDIVFHTHPFGGRICGDPREDELRFADPSGRLLEERFAFDFSRPMVLFDFGLDESGATAPLPPAVGTGLASTANNKSGGVFTQPVAGLLGLAAVGWLVWHQHRRMG